MIELYFLEHSETISETVLIGIIAFLLWKAYGIKPFLKMFRTMLNPRKSARKVVRQNGKVYRHDGDGLANYDKNSNTLYL